MYIFLTNIEIRTVAIHLSRDLQRIDTLPLSEAT